MSNNFFFIGLPYAALVIMLVGSIFRYTNFGYKVSSLSSQFLEGRELFYGSRPFHWGIIFLFFGHLVAFLFPRSVLAWNSIPVRLIILEVSAFGFGLAALFGLTMLIIRRLKNRRLLVVTSKMDAFVYVILLVQIITGLLVAYTARWGSAWFPAVLTPYLKSLFVFNPDITAVSSMPLLVKIHVISAFILIGMIPFTRFMHFLVYPFAYFFRRYQYVIWNWDRKKIRSSRKLVNGVRSKNN
ncbi:MAG: respiratory nitrate reductase subunit gamma [Lentimicrobiaceae bacterium]|jgi:nitrate reductase gamma subunit|nr:respiratory nitrate reductase subunit gamma [Lentimicrobiaceae bacterium]MCP4910126.1 respiratory nitrate reductase subunit gamma [Bacteroidota bacterium]MBT3454821.1 respiratory nitrate reductase subunit gamma [Lentimicrobiaceae bacterium]MBT3817820.1 respiratory nitrate reductase subunit gamma [Lentimicrobiaceae bacterium]MBT4061151.1 respiratory nitrate reductase subunit gamma [Lentimicrobiaceae bacterium]